MPWFHRSFWRSSPRFRPNGSRIISRSALVTALVFVGCASPGPPRAPSLGLPQPVRDLAVTRSGNAVAVHFKVPSRSTDKVPLRGGKVTGQLCRQLEHQPCVAVLSSRTTVATTVAGGKPNVVTWTDILPPDLANGRPRLLGYRVEFFSRNGRSAGPSAPAFTAAGVAPAPVEGLHAEGSRLGVVLGWTASSQAGNVLLRREDLAPARAVQKANPTRKPAHGTAPAVAWLETSSTGGIGPSSNRSLDTTALPDIPYRYSAQRRITLQLEGQSIDLRSSLSTPVTFVLREMYPPLAPTGLTVAGYFANSPSASRSTPSTFAVDLIWQPVNEAGLLAGLAGYNVYREPLSASGQPTAPRTRLNATPIPVPAFHDATASPTERYRYSVTAIDEKGNESPADEAVLEPPASH